MVVSLVLAGDRVAGGRSAATAASMYPMFHSTAALSTRPSTPGFLAFPVCLPQLAALPAESSRSRVSAGTPGLTTGVSPTLRAPATSSAATETGPARRTRGPAACVQASRQQVRACTCKQHARRAGPRQHRRHHLAELP